MAPKPLLIIYGATSFTARGLLEYLDNHPEGDDFDFVLAGRSKDKLEKTNAGLRTKREVLAVQLDDDTKVEEMVKRGDAVINFAGPYAKHSGESLLRACALQGKHYFDLCGESTWLSHMIEKYDYLASRTGACIVPSCGLDSAPSDLVLYYALRTLQSARPGVGVRSSISFFRMRGTVGGGTVATAREEAELGRERRGGEWSLAMPTIGTSLPSTPPRPVYSFHHPSLPSTAIGSFYFMYPYNRTTIRRSQWLSQRVAALVPHAASDVTAEPVHAENLSYAEAFDIAPGGRLGAWLFGVGTMLWLGLYMASGWIRRLASMFLPAPGEGASKEKLEQGSVVITNFSTSDSFPPEEIKTVYEGDGDPGYLHTCYILAESALSLVLPPPKGISLPPLSKTGGILTTSTACGMVLVERLQASGKMRIRSEFLPARGGRIKVD